MPRNVVHGAGALEPGLFGRLVVGPVEVARLAVESILAVTRLGEPERAREQIAIGRGAAGDIGPRAFDAGDGVLGGDLGMPGPERPIAAGSYHELQTQPVVVLERQRR